VIELPRAVRDITAIFERMNCCYALMGGLATRIYGIPRATFDVDFTVAIKRDRLAEFYDHVAESGYTVPEPYLAGWIDEVAKMALVKVRLYLRDRTVDVDMFLAESDYQDQVLLRRRRESAEDIDAWFVSPEDLILLKLIANRERDILDIRDVLLVQGQLDTAYMRKWAAELGVVERLEGFLTEAGHV
jgi:hypothetical protein